MKRAFAVIAILLAPTLLCAQETYSLPANATQVQKVDRARVRQNTATCGRFALAPTCTQAQACVSAEASGGASCTAAQARNANAEIFANSQAGREAFLQDRIRKDIQDFVQAAASEDQAGFCNWWKNAATQVQKDAVCTASVPPLPAGCEVCQ
jgi:hypothetical protein